MAWPNFSDLVTRVRSDLNEVSAGYFIDTDIKRWLNEGEDDIASKACCIHTINPGVPSGSNIATVANSRLIPIPFLVKVLYVEYVPAVGSPQGLVKILPKLLGRQQFNGTNPHYWFQWGPFLVIDPTHSSSYNLNVYAATFPTAQMFDTTDNPQIPAEFHELLVQYAVIRGLMKAKQWEKAGVLYQDYIQQLEILRTKYCQYPVDRPQDLELPDRVEFREASERG